MMFLVFVLLVLLVVKLFGTGTVFIRYVCSAVVQYNRCNKILWASHNYLNML